MNYNKNRIKNLGRTERWERKSKEISNVPTNSKKKEENEKRREMKEQ